MELRVLYGLLTSLDHGTRSLGFDHKFFEKDLINERTSLPDLISKKAVLTSARNITSTFVLGQNTRDLKSIPYFIKSYNKSFDEFLTECHPESFKYTLYSNAIKKEHVQTVLTYFYALYAPKGIQFYFNPIMDFRGRVYYTSVLSPTHNKAARRIAIIGGKPLSEYNEWDVPASMFTLMLRLGGQSELAGKIIDGKFDAHSFMLFKIKQYLRKLPRPGPGVFISRTMYKELASPIMYGSDPDGVPMAKRIKALFTANEPFLRPKVLE